MLDLRHVVDHLPEVRRALARKSAESEGLLESIASLAEARRAAITNSETLAARRNSANDDMSKLPKGSPEFLARRDELKALSSEQKELEKKAAEVEGEIRAILERVPNLPADSVPDGGSAAENRVEKIWGEKPKFDFTPQAHWDLGAKLGILDFERAAKISGARFNVLFGGGARLSRGLVNFMLDVHTKEHGYTEVAPPLLVKASALFGTGNLPKFEADLFKTARSEDAEDKGALYLIPTAEVPVTNIHAGELLEAKSLPVAYAAYTPCFRSEAGSHGRDVRGLIRQHQFDKVELVRLATPESAEDEHEKLTRHAESILEKLGLAYRRVLLCAGDMSFSGHKTYDLEVWLPSENTYREISSCTWFNDFQARRADLRYRPAPKEKPRHLHTINGSALAVGRTLVAVLEQYQRADGSVAIPEVLRPYVGASELVPPLDLLVPPRRCPRDFLFCDGCARRFFQAFPPFTLVRPRSEPAHDQFSQCVVGARLGTWWCSRFRMRIERRFE